MVKQAFLLGELVFGDLICQVVPGSILFAGFTYDQALHFLTLPYSYYQFCVI
jgi:hypothetical protein